jgi:hypothetical protein
MELDAPDTQYEQRGTRHGVLERIVSEKTTDHCWHCVSSSLWSLPHRVSGRAVRCLSARARKVGIRLEFNATDNDAEAVIITDASARTETARSLKYDSVPAAD